MASVHLFGLSLVYLRVRRPARSACKCNNPGSSRQVCGGQRDLIFIFLDYFGNNVKFMMKGTAFPNKALHIFFLEMDGKNYQNQNLATISITDPRDRNVNCSYLWTLTLLANILIKRLHFVKKKVNNR